MIESLIQAAFGSMMLGAMGVGLKKLGSIETKLGMLCERSKDHEERLRLVERKPQIMPPAPDSSF